LHRRARHIGAFAGAGAATASAAASGARNRAALRNIGGARSESVTALAARRQRGWRAQRRAVAQRLRVARSARAAQASKRHESETIGGERGVNLNHVGIEGGIGEAEKMISW